MRIISVLDLNLPTDPIWYSTILQTSLFVFGIEVIIISSLALVYLPRVTIPFTIVESSHRHHRPHQTTHSLALPSSTWKTQYGQNQVVIQGRPVLNLKRNLEQPSLVLIFVVDSRVHINSTSKLFHIFSLPKYLSQSFGAQACVCWKRIM